jgi:D-glycero-D-manno-heptose 1,7-bisphosphate phosphatase
LKAVVIQTERIFTYDEFVHEDGIRLLLSDEVSTHGRSAVFLDRDGVINVAPPPREYITKWSDFRFIFGVDRLLRYFKSRGFLTIVVTNQRGVAMNRITQPALDSIHENMIADLAQRGAVLDDIFWCPHDLGSCKCRKPLPGMVVGAVRTWGIDLTRSIMLGDSSTDEQLAEDFGLPFLKVYEGQIMRFKLPTKRRPDICAQSWDAAPEVLHLGDHRRKLPKPVTHVS